MVLTRASYCALRIFPPRDFHAWHRRHTHHETTVGVSGAVCAGDEVVGLQHHSGRIRFAHAVAESDQDLQALIDAATTFSRPGFLLPTRNHELFKWCLDKGLRLVMQMNFMTTGVYNEPTGPYLPLVLY